MTTFTGSTLAATNTRNGNSLSTAAAATWDVEFAHDVLLSDYVTDIRAAGDYTFKIDGVTEAVVTGIAAAATAVHFTPATPVLLAAGVHTFQLAPTSAVQWYTRTDLGSVAPTSPTGTGADYVGWYPWQEYDPTFAFVPGELSFKLADGLLVSGIVNDTISISNIAAQTWSVTFDEDVVFFGLRKRLRNAVAYTLKIDGTTYDSHTKASGTNLLDVILSPATPLLLTAGAHTFKLEPPSSIRWAYDAGTGSSPAGSGSSHTTAWGTWNEASTNKVDALLYFALPTDVPTAVSASPDVDAIDLTWSPPASGGPVDSYEVRIDAGAWTAATSPHTFGGLLPDTSYDLEVRALGIGGTGDAVLVTAMTDSAPTEQGFYRVELTLGDGDHVWEFGSRDSLDLATDYPHVRLPITMGWDINDSVEFFPAQPSLTTLSFSIQCDDASELADVVRGTHVAFRMYVEAGLLAEPWQTFNGVITQLDAVTVVSPADVTKRDLVISVYAADDNVRLAGAYVGYTADWPVEHIDDRFDRICAEISATPDDLGFAMGVGRVGWLNARPQGAPINALQALQQTLKDASDDYDSEPPDHFYGRYVFQYQPEDPDAWTIADPYVVGVYVFRRRVYSTTTLDGGFVRAAGSWSKAPGPAAATWSIIDGTEFGTPDSSTPYVRNTSLFDTTSEPDPVNYSAAERDNLGESLLPDGSTALDGWASRSLVYEASRDLTENLADVALWASPQHNRGFVVTPVVVTPIGPELELNAVDYVAGTLTGARLLLSGGRFSIEFRLRAELLTGTDLPA